MKKRNWGTGRGVWTRELSDNASVSDHVSRKHPQRKTGRQQFITGDKRPKIPCPLKTPSESEGKLRSFLAMTLSYFLSAGHPCFLSENFPHFLSAYLFYFLWGKTLLLNNELPQHPLRGSPLLPVRESPLLPVQCLPFFQSVDFLYFTSSDPFYFLWAGPSYFLLGYLLLYTFLSGDLPYFLSSDFPHFLSRVSFISCQQASVSPQRTSFSSNDKGRVSFSGTGTIM